MAYRITGRVLHIGATDNLLTKTGTQFTKRDLVIIVRKFDPYTGVPSEDSGNTPKFTFMNANCQLLDNIKVGDIVTVMFDVNGRSYEKDGRTEYFTDLRPFRIEQQRQTYQQPQAASQPIQDPLEPIQTINPNDVQTTAQIDSMASQMQNDDLPF